VYLKRNLATGTGVLKETPGYRDRCTYRDYWLQGQGSLRRPLARLTGEIRKFATGTGLHKETTAYRDRRTKTVGFRDRCT